VYRINRKFWRRNKEKVIFGALIIGSLAIQQKDIGANFAAMDRLKGQVRENSTSQLELEEMEENAKAQAAIANERLKRGCTPVVDAKSITKDKQGRKVFNLASLIPGQPVNDRNGVTKLVPGTCVVDALGNTGMINKEWKVDAIAVGGDSKLVDLNIRKVTGRSNVVYRVTPSIGGSGNVAK
jgi:hypothetical protein